jgi:hypothetical protein
MLGNRSLMMVCLMLAGAVEASELSTKPAPKVNPRIQQRFAASQSNEFTYAFMGDSITHFWESKGKKIFERNFGDKKILNVATSGDRTENTIWVIDQVL